MKTTTLLPWIGLGALLSFMFKPEEAAAGTGTPGPPLSLKARLAKEKSRQERARRLAFEEASTPLPNPCFNRVSRTSPGIQGDLIPSS